MLRLRAPPVLGGFTSLTFDRDLRDVYTDKWETLAKGGWGVKVVRPYQKRL